MIGIYREEFVSYLKENLDYVKITAKNIITKCPFCEYGKNKKHYHLYISLEFPIWRCFQARCNQSGFLQKLLDKISGIDKYEQFVDKSLIKESSHRKLDTSLKEKKSLKIPELSADHFKLKAMYMKYRLGFDVELSSINKLVFDVEEFVRINNVKLDEKTQKLMDFLQSNFVGFVTENDGLLILRNIDPNASFRYYKLELGETDFLEYYKVVGGNFNSNRVVISEGIFDILVEQRIDSLRIRNDVKLYAAGLSGSFSSLLKAIVFNEQIYRLQVVVLSHSDVNIEVYKKLKKYDSHIIDSLSVFYNETGKDFSTFPINPVRVVL